MNELMILGGLILVGTVWSVWYLIELSRRALAARERLVELERERADSAWNAWHPPP